MPAKYSTIDAGGVNFQITATERKELHKMIDEMKKVKSFFEAQYKVRERIYQLQVKQAFSSRGETKNYENRLSTLGKIWDRMHKMNVDYMEYLKKSNSYIPRTAGPKYNVGGGNKLWSQAIYGSASDQWITATGGKRVENAKKEGTLLDWLKKKYAWQLLYFTALALVIGGMVSNSKVFSQFVDIIGSALGFILDMLLLPLIDGVTWLVTKLFELGGWLADLPGWARVAILVFGGLFSTVGALLLYGVLKTIAGQIVAIGAESIIAKTFVDSLLTTTAGAAALAASVGYIASLTVEKPVKNRAQIEEQVRTIQKTEDYSSIVPFWVKPFNAVGDWISSQRSGNVTVYIDGFNATRIQGINLNVVQ